MDKQTFENEFKALNVELADIHRRMKLLQKNYINSNKQFEVGDKVLVTTRKGTAVGFVDNIRLWNNTSEIIYELKKAKKDGTPSQIALSNYDIIKIEKL